MSPPPSSLHVQGWALRLGAALLAAGLPLHGQGAVPADVGPGAVEVHTAFGGFILGYDVDQAGKVGVLAEALTLPGGKHDVAVETFDLRTGQLLDVVVQELGSKNDYVVLGVTGSHSGLIEFEHVTDLFVDQRLYGLMDPVAAGTFTGLWTPPLTTSDIIAGVTRSQGDAETAFLVMHNVGGGSTLLFSSHVAANTFGPLWALTDPNFAPNHTPKIALDAAHHQAIVAALGPNPFGPPKLGKVDLATGTASTFTGLGTGYVNGLAVDSASGVACTSTEIDFRIQIYDLAMQTGFPVLLPGALSQAHSGQDVQLDRVHKLFLVGQPISSTAPTGSSVHVFDEHGLLVESIDGLQLPAGPALLALAPRMRTGFVVRAPNLDTLQTFKY